MNATLQKFRKSFFIRLVLLLVIFAGAHRFFEGALHLAGFLQADRWLGFYGYPDHAVFNIALVIAGPLMVWGALQLRKGSWKGFARYMAGKLLLLAGEISAVVTHAAASGRTFPWDTLLALVCLWIWFPLLIFTHRKYWPHARIHTA